jgi:hypothetical protein
MSSNIQEHALFVEEPTRKVKCIKNFRMDSFSSRTADEGYVYPITVVRGGSIDPRGAVVLETTGGCLWFYDKELWDEHFVVLDAEEAKTATIWEKYSHPDVVSAPQPKEETMLQALCVEEYFHKDEKKFDYGTTCSFRLQNSSGVPSVYVIDLARTVDMVMTTAEFFKHFQEISVVPAKPTAADMAKRTKVESPKEYPIPDAVWDHIRAVKDTQTSVYLSSSLLGTKNNHEVSDALVVFKNMGYEVTIRFDCYNLVSVTGLVISWEHLLKEETNNGSV